MSTDSLTFESVLNTAAPPPLENLFPARDPLVGDDLLIGHWSTSPSSSPSSTPPPPPSTLVSAVEQGSGGGEPLVVGTARVYTGSTKPTPEQGHVHFFPAETGVRMGVPVEEDIAVVLPFYNEEGVELRHSLQSLVVQERVMNERILARSHRGVSPRPRRLLVCIIMDGWGKASASMKAYLAKLFPFDWAAIFEPDRQEGDPPVLANPDAERVRSAVASQAQATVVINAVSVGAQDESADHPVSTAIQIFGEDHEWGANPQLDQDLPTLHVTLLVKGDNRRKHNSHIWFLAPGGFGPSTNARLYFLTDGGTMYKPDCLLQLYNYMFDHKNAVACTGRQRVMTRGMQESNEHLLSFTTWFRLAIMYDYEASFACFMGAFALSGFLPVIPGPCGLYRRRYLEGTPLHEYFELLEKEPSETGIIQGNLRIAEDRVLTYAPLLHGNYRVPSPQGQEAPLASARAIRGSTASNNLCFLTRTPKYNVTRKTKSSRERSPAAMVIVRARTSTLTKACVGRVLWVFISVALGRRNCYSFVVEAPV